MRFAVCLHQTCSGHDPSDHLMRGNRSASEKEMLAANLDRNSLIAERRVLGLIDCLRLNTPRLYHSIMLIDRRVRLDIPF